MPDLRSHTDYFLHLLASLAAVTAAVYACVHIVACDYCMREAKKKAKSMASRDGPKFYLSFFPFTYFSNNKWRLQ